MDLVFVNLIDGLVTGMLLFMLSSGLTLIFSMMGVLNFAHASFYMLGAYFAYQISTSFGFWTGLLIAPVIVGIAGALVERYGLRRVHQYGHVPELIFTFGLALLIEEIVQFFWGKNQIPYDEPAILDFTLFAINGNGVSAYRIFMIFVAMGIFMVLLYILTRTRIGLIIQAALSHPNTVQNLGHNVPQVFMGVFGVGTALAGVAAAAYNFEFADLLMALGLEKPADLASSKLRDLWTLTLPQIGPILPYILMVVILVFRPFGLFGKREV